MDPEHWQQEDGRGSIDSCFAQMPRSASAQMVRLAAATAQGCYLETGLPILSWIVILYLNSETGLHIVVMDRNFVLKICAEDPDPHQTKWKDPDPHQIAKVDLNPDPHQFPDDKLKCYGAYALFEGLEPLFEKLGLIFRDGAPYWHGS
jgi:hypothetical protein